MSSSHKEFAPLEIASSHGQNNMEGKKLMQRKSVTGFATLYFVLLALFFVVSLAGSSFLVLSWQQRVWRNAQNSSQAYWAAEAGAEDAFLRLKTGMPWTNPISFNAGEGITTTAITETNPGTYLVAAQGDDASRVRKVQAVFGLTGATPSFFYGAQVGDGGLHMDNASEVIGNVYSNGNIQATSRNAEITETAIVAGTGGTVSGISAKNVFADICSDSTVAQELHSNTPGDCAYGSFIPLGSPSSLAPLPINNEEIQQWKDDALAGGVYAGDYELGGSSIATIGPKKIAGSLEIENNAILTLSGTLWVAGNVNVKNNSRVKLASSYGQMSGVIVADGTITLENDSVSEGSGDPDSYLIYLSTNSSNPALIVKNNAVADILYTSQGWIEVQNNAQLVEVTGYGIHLKNNVIIQYETGIQDARFTAGPGAGWEVQSWEEVE